MNHTTTLQDGNLTLRPLTEADIGPLCDLATAHAEAAAFRLLEQDGADHDGDDHEVNDDDNGLHSVLPSQADSAETAADRASRVFLKLRGVTRSGGALPPPIGPVPRL